jgi:hypothetical protein
MQSARARPPQQLASSADVAELLQVPEHTLAQWRWRGTGPAFIRVGRYVRYDLADVQRWLAQRKTTAGAAC